MQWLSKTLEDMSQALTSQEVFQQSFLILHSVCITSGLEISCTEHKKNLSARNNIIWCTDIWQVFLLNLILPIDPLILIHKLLCIQQMVQTLAFLHGPEKSRTMHWRGWDGEERPAQETWALAVAPLVANPWLWADHPTSLGPSLPLYDASSINLENGEESENSMVLVHLQQHGTWQRHESAISCAGLAQVTTMEMPFSRQLLCRRSVFSTLFCARF